VFKRATQVTQQHKLTDTSLSVSDIFSFVPVVTLFTVMAKPSSSIVSTVDAFATMSFEPVQLSVKTAMLGVVTAVAGC
jgi:hypothetical protein